MKPNDRNSLGKDNLKFYNKQNYTCIMIDSITIIYYL